MFWRHSLTISFVTAHIELAKNALSSRTCLLGLVDMELLRKNSRRSNPPQAVSRRPDMTCTHRTIGKHLSASSQFRRVRNLDR
jgi:hypothetical protein